MLEALDLSSNLPKDEAKPQIATLQSRLHQLQRACHDAQIANIIVFEGWDAAGKGSMVKKLTERLEPRAFTLHSTHEPRTYELQMPWMWRFWRRIPNWGEMAIFHRSWYHRLIQRRSEGEVDDRDWLRLCRDIRFFEDTLSDDHYVLTKFFLHIDKEEQRRRLEKMESDPWMEWRVSDDDWRRHERYDEDLVAVEETLQQTEGEWGPWTLIEAHDKQWTRVRVFTALVHRLEEALRERAAEDFDYESEDTLDRALDDDLDA